MRLLTVIALCIAVNASAQSSALPATPFAPGSVDEDHAVALGGCYRLSSASGWANPDLERLRLPTHIWLGPSQFGPGGTDFPFVATTFELNGVQHQASWSPVGRDSAQVALSRTTFESLYLFVHRADSSTLRGVVRFFTDARMGTVDRWAWERSPANSVTLVKERGGPPGNQLGRACTLWAGLMAAEPVDPPGRFALSDCYRVVIPAGSDTIAGASAMPAFVSLDTVIHRTDGRGAASYRLRLTSRDGRERVDRSWSSRGGDSAVLSISANAYSSTSLVVNRRHADTLDATVIQVNHISLARPPWPVLLVRHPRKAGRTVVAGCPHP